MQDTQNKVKKIGEPIQDTSTKEINMLKQACGSARSLYKFCFESFRWFGWRGTQTWRQIDIYTFIQCPVSSFSPQEAWPQWFTQTLSKLASWWLDLLFSWGLVSDHGTHRSLVTCFCLTTLLLPFHSVGSHVPIIYIIPITERFDWLLSCLRK